MKACGRFVELVKTPVGGDGYACTYPRMKGKQSCVWHWLLKQPAAVQRAHATSRLVEWRQTFSTPEAATRGWRARVPTDEWPEGERWCTGCQSFVPLFYTSGSRCKSCASEASHAARVEKVYGITKDEYEALFELQGGRCFICQRKSTSRRLAVDHDHETGTVRGLLCPDPDRGCNHAILGNIKDVAMARRILLYLARTPYERLKDGGGGLTWDRYVRDEVMAADRKILDERYAAVQAAGHGSSGTPGQRPPF